MSSVDSVTTVVEGGARTDRLGDRHVVAALVGARKTIPGAAANARFLAWFGDVQALGVRAG
ncbi:hypothetical protein [Nakamurella sp. PAMC28650]|uniref:hypothetical protein n=1 Tax=Nakamurella sp. PAMC28650 TaxID=2762325 RepID=UPI00164E1553|nr:hypothetical protein [Nakamurella sp. PAMC28650]QNK80980.1 hypothetical protein H7F38_23335 [Nakamurella sp. PAMC28650]